MAILSTYIDKTTVSRVGDDLKGVTVGTLSHSLATNPDTVLCNVRSIAAIGVQPSVSLLGLGANASIATIGYAIGSTASCPTVMFDVFSIYFQSKIR